MVVASYDQPAGEPVRFQVGPHIQGLKAAADGKERAILKVAGSFWSGEVLLAPGTAALFTCSVDAKNLPTSYRDDFTTDRFSADAVSVRNVRRHSDLVLSASGGEDAKDAEVIYDLGKWLPVLPAGGIRTLTTRAWRIHLTCAALSGRPRPISRPGPRCRPINSARPYSSRIITSRSA